VIKSASLSGSRSYEHAGFLNLGEHDVLMRLGIYRVIGVMVVGRLDMSGTEGSKMIVGKYIFVRSEGIDL